MERSSLTLTRNSILPNRSRSLEIPSTTTHSIVSPEKSSLSFHKRLGGQSNLILSHNLMLPKNSRISGIFQATALSIINLSFNKSHYSVLRVV